MGFDWTNKRQFVDVATSGAKGCQPPTREEVPDDLKWRLEDLFPTDEAWEAEFREVKAELERAGRLQGAVGASARNLLEALRLDDAIGQKLERLVGYAVMRRDENNQNPTYQAMTQRAVSLSAQAASALAYITPEILALEPDQVERYLEENKDLALYRHALEDLMRRKPHVLSAREEQILAEVGELAHEPETIFDMLNHADFDFGTIQDEEGREVKVTHGRFIQFLRSRDRRVRRDAFQSVYRQYHQHKNTLAAVFNASVKGDVFFARMRRYPSALEAALDPDNVPRSVYDNLIAAVREELPLLHRYLRLRRRLLGIDELHMYDLYVPLVRDVEFEVPYEQARGIIKDGLRPLGDAYGRVIDRAFQERWIDVCENAGKTSGAYVRDVYGVHPFILLNYQGDLDDLFTLAHEMGHAAHSHFSQEAQPYVYANYSLFVAEVASTVNEALLVNFLLDAERDPRRRLYILNYSLEQFRTTVFRQTMFAEFERKVHEQVEQGEALTAESLSEVYRGLNRDYYGAEVHLDPEIDMEWARIPHFYNAFYVYKYATGFSAANALAQAILTGSDEVVSRYIRFLSSGGSDYPLNQLRAAGVDMTSPEPVRAALRVFDRLLDETEALALQRATDL